MSFQVEIINDLIVLSGDKNSFEYPMIWLRDNCQCAECFDPKTYTRTIDWDNFDFDVKPEKVEVNFKEKKLFNQDLIKCQFQFYSSAKISSK
jgi:hypothetical protein